LILQRLHGHGDRFFFWVAFVHRGHVAIALIEDTDIKVALANVTPARRDNVLFAGAKALRDAGELRDRLQRDLSLRREIGESGRQINTNS
jgi:hypothetical protein